MATLSSLIGTGVKNIIKGNWTVDTASRSTTGGTPITLSISLGATVVPAKCTVDIPSLAVFGADGSTGLAPTKQITYALTTTTLDITWTPASTSGALTTYFTAALGQYYNSAGTHAVASRLVLPFTVVEYY